MHCPGCGLTRCGHALLNGELRQAVAYNLLGIAFLPWLGFLILSTLWRLAVAKSPAVRRPRRGRVNWAYVVMFGLFAFWVVRNVPLFRSRLLAPHEVAPDACALRANAGELPRGPAGRSWSAT